MSEILSYFAIVNQLYPELRFQQIASIAANKAGWTSSDLFYCPDETILNGLKLICGERDDI